VIGKLSEDKRTSVEKLEVIQDYPSSWEIRRAKTLFIQRDDRGYDDLPLLEVSLNHGVRLRDDNEDRNAWVASDLGDMKRVAKGDLVFNKMRLWQGAVGRSEYEGLVSPDYTVLEPYLKLIRLTTVICSKRKLIKLRWIADRMALWTIGNASIGSSSGIYHYFTHPFRTGRNC